MPVTTSRSARALRISLALGAIFSVVVLTARSAQALPVGTITTVVGGLSGPHGLVYDANNNSVFIADTTNCQVLQDNLTTSTVTVAVNGPAVCGPFAAAGTPALVAPLNHPHGLAINRALNLLYIADRDNHGIDVVDLTTMKMENFIPLLPGAPISAPVGVSVDQVTGTLYVADQSLDVIWDVPLGGSPSIFAGVFNTPGFNGNGIPPTTAKLNGPSGVDFVSGVLYLADTLNNEVRSVWGGLIRNVVGSPLGIAGFSADGSAATSPITAPVAVRLDGGGTLFFDELGFNLVREIDGSALIQTVAGGGPILFPYSGNPATSVTLNSPHGLTFVPVTAASADLWFSDTNNNVVDTVTGVASGAGFGSSPGIDSANSATGAVGQPFSFLVTTTGSPAPKIKEKGKLPKGVKFHKNGDGTATISGTPKSTKHKSAAGLYRVTFTATFGTGHSKVVATQSWALNVTL